MRVLRNIFFLYFSLIGGFILNFIQLKILSVWLTPVSLGEFFTINAFCEILAGILLLGAPFVLVRYLPKYQAQGESNKMFSLLLVLILIYFLLSILTYGVLHFFGYKLGITIYNNEIIGRHLGFGFVVSFSITLFFLIFMAFNGLRKMHYSALLNLLYLSLLTGLLFIFRSNLTILIVLRIYLFSVLPSIVLGAILLFHELGNINLSNIFSEIGSYWKYAILLSILSPLFGYLDRLLIGYFLTMPLVAGFSIASKIRSWTARVLEIPIDALTPEISYSWEIDRKEVIGRDLGLVIKLYFFVSLAICTPILIVGKEIICIVSSYKYLGAFTPLVLLIFSTILSSLYTPIATAMRATGKILLHLCSDVIWIFCYVIFTVLLITKFSLVGVGVAHLLSTLITLGFNFIYVVRYHTELEVDFCYLYKTIGFGILFGVFTYFIWQYVELGVIYSLVLLFLFIGVGYFLFLIRGNIFTVSEKDRLRTLFSVKYGFLSKLLT